MSSIQILPPPATPTKRPGNEELVAFANKANDIDIGGFSEMDDDLGMSLLANTNRINVSTRREDVGSNTITLDSGNDSRSGGVGFAEELEFVNLDSMGSTRSATISLPTSSASGEIFRTDAPTTFDTNTNSAVGNNEDLSPEKEAQDKTSYLIRLQRLAGKGITGQRMTMSNSLDEIKGEYARLVDSRNLEASVKFQRNALMTFATGLEFLNNRFNPVDVHLDGWSETVNENVEDYDEIFEELYDKYKEKAKMPPEVRLVMTLGASAAMFHITNSYFKSKMPGMDDILRNNPDLAKQFATAAANQVSPGFGNFVGSAMNSGRGQQQQQQQQQSEMNMPFGRSSRAGDEMPSAPTARREMRGPTGVDDILRAFANEQDSFDNPPRPNIGMNVAPIFPASNGSSPPAPTSLNSLREGLGGDMDPLKEVTSILEEMQSVGTDTTRFTSDESRRRRGRRSNAQPLNGSVLNLNV